MLYCLLLPIAQTTSTFDVPINTLNLSSMTTGWNQPKANKSVDGNEITIAGKRYATGVGTHAVSEYTLQLFGKAKRFRALVGVDDEMKAGKGSVAFRVVVDGRVRGRTPVMHGGDPALPLDVDLSGAKIMRLVVTDGNDGIDSDHADWAEAVITMADAKTKPKPASVPHDPPMPLAPVDLTRTQINGPRIVGFSDNRDFLFRIPATGRRPMTFTAKGLPEGLHLDGTRGVITGRVPAAGRWEVDVEAKGAGGRDHRRISFVAGKGKLALTPPMGWNSWNVWAGAVDAQKIRDAANSFVKTGLADFGYQYVNIDDCWMVRPSGGQRGRDANGRILVNEKFGDIASLAQYIHNLGLKIGTYSSPGPTTCAGFEGSYQFEEQDAQAFAEWGIDYLKYDWCSYGGIKPSPSLYEMKEPYIKMHEALERSGRDIVLSLCQYGMGDVYKWGQSVGGSLWRTTGDITDTWDSMAGIGFSHSPRSLFVKPGGWNDPDMLVVGKLGWGANPRPTRLTPNEQITHITLWSLLAAPLIIGCDLTQIDDFTRRLLMNHDVIEVDQDSLGKAAVRRAQNGDTEVWARPLWDGTTAVGLFNRGYERAKVTVKWSDIDVRGMQAVRDLWQRKDMGVFPGSYTVSVPAHGAVLIKVGGR